MQNYAMSPDLSDGTHTQGAITCWAPQDKSFGRLANHDILSALARLRGTVEGLSTCARKIFLFIHINWW